MTTLLKNNTSCADITLDEAPSVDLPMNDREYVESLIAQGMDMIDGGLNTVPELKLPCLLDYADLRHIGFGHFEDNTGLFLRHDSPWGTRFYEYIPDAIPVSVPA